MIYSKHFNTNETPQSEAIPGSNQAPNSGGGFSFAVDSWTQLDRFLILGTEGGSYYATERALTQDNAKSVLRCVQTDGERVVRRVVEISDSGRAPKNDPAVFVLAMCAKLGNDATRQAARDALPKVCRIGTHLFQFAEALQGFGGWGRGTRNAVAKWYNDKPIDKLAMQAIKYQSRNGWAHRDLLRLAHPKTSDTARNEIYRWIVKGKGETSTHPIIDAFERAKTITNVKEMCALIQEHKLPREAVPTHMLTQPEVWEALLPDMGLTALIRNLATMTRVGLLKPLSKAASTVADRITDSTALRDARIHPVQVLAALLTYKAGHGALSQNTWTPVSRVIDALDEAFYASFPNVQPTGRSIMLALDVSGSMTGGTIAGVPGLTPRVASAAMAMTIARTEKNYMFTVFTDGIKEIDITSKMRLDQVCNYVDRMPFSATNCALPMTYATENKIDVEAFVILTDSETNYARIHPSQAIKAYRKSRRDNAKVVVAGMVSNGFSIADPNDAGMLDLVGFDTAAPLLIADFIR